MGNVVNKLQRSFDECFSRYSDIQIGIYGIGKNAKTILENITGYNFDCLIATDHINETVYGLKVVSLSEAIDRVGLIIIAAIPSSAAIVYNRIKDSVPDDIPIYDLQGYLLRGDDNYKNNPYWDSNISELQQSIDSHDVISFDVFDTLISRIVLAPRDVLDLMDIDPEFKCDRIKAEEELYETYQSPTMTQIYDKLASDRKWNDEYRNSVFAKELQIEQSALNLRRPIYDLFKYAVNQGKRVYLTSDMYIENVDLKKMLSAIGLSEGYDLIVSCDYGKTKETGELYDVLLNNEKGKSILHIGDNKETDIEKANLKGIDSFYVKKGYDILAESSCAYLFDLIRTDDDRRLLGYSVSVLLNDPFSLNDTRGKLNICSYDHIAVCILPMTLLYLSKIVSWASDYDEILFASRDGYFIYKLYEWYRKENSLPDLPEGKYIYVSRSAISSMSVKSIEDIEVFLNKIVDDPKLNLKSLIENQFHLSVSAEFNILTGEAVENWGVCGIKAKISEYYDHILENAKKYRNRYLKYTERSGIKVDGKTVVVDIVTQGTLVYGLSSIFNNNIDLIALGTSTVPNKYITDASRVHSVYGNITERIGDSIYSMSDFAELHLFIEMLYASKDGQFYSVDDEMNPGFVPGSEYNSDLLEGVQATLRAMVERFVVDGDIPEISPGFALGMLRTFSKKFSVFSEEMKAGFSFEDPYDGSIQKCNLIDFIQ